MEQLSQEIFNILKGANYKLRLFTDAGIKTLEPTEATRFYAFDQDLMITLRQDDAKLEVVVQAGQDYDLLANKKLLSAIKAAAHKNLGEYTVRKFDKNIAPKDFAHQSVTESAFGKAYGSIKTSYIPSPNAKLVIKHTDKVNEEKRGARSRNIHSLFIENTQGERFAFPYKYMAGAKAMTMHVNEGGTPYDSKGQAILEMCAEISELSKFVKHTRSNKLVNESNQDIVEAIKSRIAEQKDIVKSLSTRKGYNNFTVQENIEENSEIDVDISEQFLYNTFTAEEMQSVVSRVNRIVSENRKKDSMQKELIGKLFDIIKSGADLGLDLDPNDPENPNNEDQVKYSGPSGINAKLSAMLSFLAVRSKNDELSNVLAQLSEEVHDMKPDMKIAVAKFVNYAMKSKPAAESVQFMSVEESVIGDLRKKIS